MTLGCQFNDKGPRQAGEASKARALPWTRQGHSPWNQTIKVFGVKGANTAIETAVSAPLHTEDPNKRISKAPPLMGSGATPRPFLLHPIARSRNDGASPAVVVVNRQSNHLAFDDLLERPIHDAEVDKVNFDPQVGG